MLRASIASFACLALCVPLALAQRTETESRSTKESSRPPGTSSRPPATTSRPPSTSSHSPTEATARKLPERSMTMEQEAEAKRRAQRRQEEEARRQAIRLQQQEALRHRHVVPAPVVIVPATPAPPAAGAPVMGGAAPITTPATTPAPTPSGGIVVSCSAAPLCPAASGGYGNVCKGVELTYGGANAASVGRRDIVTVCQQANSPEACGEGHPGGPAAASAYRSSFGGGCIQQCVNAGRCTAQSAGFR